MKEKEAEQLAAGKVEEEKLAKSQEWEMNNPPPKRENRRGDLTNAYIKWMQKRRNATGMAIPSREELYAPDKD